jgi:2-C-methyl-D-erythritol 4-phosphate cytidylyltransferase
MNIGVILSGGAGSRFGGARPKQYRSLCGKEIIGYAAEALKRSALTDRILIIAAKAHLARLQSAYGLECAEAGDTHNVSAKNGLDFIHTHYPRCRNVLFADAARPFITAEIADRYFTLLEDFDGVITAQPITDSLGQEGVSFTDRSRYYLIQKPEAFRFPLIYAHFFADSNATALVQQLPAQAAVKRCFDLRQNLKITYPEDLPLAEYWMGLSQGRRASSPKEQNR